MTDANLGFTKVLDTIHDSKVLEGLVDNGILPRSLQMIQCTVDLTGQAVGTDTVIPLTNDLTGNQVQLSAGQQVVILKGGASQAITTEANLDGFQVGLAATATGAIAETLSADVTGEILGAATGTGISLVTDANGGVVGSTNTWGVVEVTVSVAALTAGEVKLLLVVV